MDCPAFIGPKIYLQRYRVPAFKLFAHPGLGGDFTLKYAPRSILHVATNVGARVTSATRTCSLQVVGGGWTTPTGSGGGGVVGSGGGGCDAVGGVGGGSGGTGANIKQQHRVAAVLVRKSAPGSPTPSSASSYGTASSSNDLIASASSALRRLHFKSTGAQRMLNRSKQQQQQQQVPKFTVLGSSSVSVESAATVNTSTDSSAATMTTVTDDTENEGSIDNPVRTDSFDQPPRRSVRFVQTRFAYRYGGINVFAKSLDRFNRIITV